LKKTLTVTQLTLSTVAWILSSPASASAQDFLSPQEVSQRLTNGETPDSSAEGVATVVPLDDLIPQTEQRRIDARRARRQAMRVQVQGVAGNDYSLFPASVDLRYRDSPVKKQFGGTCTSFGLIAAMENLLDDPSGVDISERHFWSLYRKYSSSTAIKTALKKPVTREELWPQNKTNPKSGYKSGAVFQLTSARFIDDDIPDALRALNAGNPVYIGMRVPADMDCSHKVIGPKSKATKGGHAIAIVGYQLDPSLKSGGYFILKNSWGSKCGDKGYHYLDFNNCQRSDMYCNMWAIEGVRR
jgi:C1A family cysteine protease